MRASPEVRMTKSGYDDRNVARTGSGRLTRFACGLGCGLPGGHQTCMISSCLPDSISSTVAINLSVIACTSVSQNF